jgi:hypothetical protein
MPVVAVLVMAQILAMVEMDLVEAVMLYILLVHLG